jgi:hypothetical protein
MKIKLEGRSGCPILIIEKGGVAAVRKSSSGLHYNERLTKQAIKQDKFKEWQSSNTGFFAPLVLQTGMDETGIAFFEMEYARGEKFSDFFPNLSLKGIDNIIFKLLNYFNYSFEKSVLSSPDSKVIHDKIIEVETKVKAMAQFDEKLKSKLFDYLSKQVPQSKLPLSYCHGDFTFSNMLFNDLGQVYIFDFLDSFIESPIIDIVKLRQDTRFYWSVEIDENLQNHKVLKVIQVLNYIDRKIESYIQTLSSDYREWYQYLEIINLARIMPYAIKDSDFNFLNKNLTQLLNKI